MDLSEGLKGLMKRMLYSDGFVGASQNFKTQHRKVLENSEDVVTAELLFLTQRARHLYWNYGLVSNGVESFAQNLGVIGVSFVDSKGQEVPFWKEAWEKFSAKLGADGSMNWASMQNIVARSIAVEGESFGKRIATVDDPDIPFQIQLIPSFQVPLNYMDISKQIFNGIQFDGAKPRIYHVLPKRYDLKELREAMASGFNGLLQYEADKVFHVWQKKFPEQLRGVPLMTPIMGDVWRHMDLSASVTQQAVNSASFAYGLKNSPNMQSKQNPMMTMKQGAKDKTLSGENASPIDFYETEAGQFLHGAEEIQILQSQGIERGIDDMLRLFQQIISTALYSTSFQVDGDCSRYNYSSMRAAWTAVEGKINLFRSVITEPMLVLVVIGWFMEAIRALQPYAPEAKPLLRYPRNAVANLLELMRAYEIAANNHLLPITKIFDELGIDPTEFNSDFQKMWEALQKQQKSNIADVAL